MGAAAAQAGAARLASTSIDRIVLYFLVAPVGKSEDIPQSVAQPSKGGFIMRRPGLCLVLVAILISCGSIARADWMLRVETSSRVCHVQKQTAAPLGIDLHGPFSTRKDACQSAASEYDKTLSDTSKCWTYGSGTVRGCGNEGITLPP